MKLSVNIVQKYLEMCEKQKKLDWKTVKAYRIDLRQFMFFSKSRGGLKRETVKAYISDMNEKYRPRTVKRKLASLRAFSSWLEEEGLLRDDPFRGPRLRVREPAELPKALPLRSVGRLLEAAHARAQGGGKAALCEAAVLELLFATGIRVSELCGLQTRDIDLSDGVIRIWGKGSKERVIQLVNSEVLALLRLYAQECGPGGGAFFRNRRGGRLSDQSVRRMVRKYARAAGFAVRVTPHMFRHSLATLLLENGVDIRYIQQLLGHASIRTTQIYTHVAGAKQRGILMEKHPRNQFSFATCAKSEDNTLLSTDCQV